MMMTRVLNQYEWMLLYGDKLVDLLVEDGKMNGPRADSMLSEVQKLEAGGKVREMARRLLKQKLHHRGFGHIFDL